MKREYFRIVKSDPWFVIKTYLHKLASIVVFVLLYANIGLVFSLYVRRSWRELIPLFITALYTAIPALVISPYERYSLGLISLSLIFAIYMVSLGIEKYMREAEITPQLQPMQGLHPSFLSSLFIMAGSPATWTKLCILPKNIISMSLKVQPKLSIAIIRVSLQGKCSLHHRKNQSILSSLKTFKIYFFPKWQKKGGYSSLWQILNRFICSARVLWISSSLSFGVLL